MEPGISLQALATRATSAARQTLCVVCRARPAVNPNAEHPACGSCKSSISRLTRLDEERMREAEKRAVTRIRRVIAAQVGVGGLVEKTQRLMSESEDKS